MHEGKVRVRGCGILIEDGCILLAAHKNLGPDVLWIPPGGGVEFGQDLPETLVRELEEETSLKVAVEDFLFVNEFRSDKYHAVEVFFSIRRLSGDLALGHDPEFAEQMLTDLRFFSDNDLKMIPEEMKHSIFSEIQHIEDLNKLRGYYKFDRLS